MSIVNNKKKLRIQSLVRAFKILNLLSEENELPLGKIADKLGLPKTTTHGLISTLKGFRYVDQSVFNGNYGLGTMLFTLGSKVAKKWSNLPLISTPYLQKLVNELKETSHLAILDRGEILYINKVECTRSLKIVSEVGSRLPSHCTALGKVLLSYLDKSKRAQIVIKKGLKAFTKNTITDPYILENEVEKIKKQGYAVDNEEILENLKCIAAPVYNYQGSVIAALSISGPVFRLSDRQFYTAVEKVKSSAMEISTALGYKSEKNETDKN